MKKLIILPIVFIILLFLSSGKCMAQQSAAKAARVFITAGQSNTDGRVSSKLLPDYIKAKATDTVEYKSGQYRHCKIVQNKMDGQFAPYWPKGRMTDGLWTYDAIVYHWVEEAIHEDFYVVKYAVGGTSIQYPNDSAKGRYWSANPEWLSKTTSYEKKGNSLLLSFTDAIDAAIDQTLSKIEQGYRIEAFLWHQGESDARYATKYYDNLKGVIAYVRQHLTTKTGHDYSQLPFIFGSIPHASRDYRLDVEVAMQRIAQEDPNVYLIDISDQELQKDKLHFTDKTAEYMGLEIYKTLEKILDLSDTQFRIARYRDDKACAISYTFDDGLQEHYTLVAPALEKQGFKGTFWINGNTLQDSVAARGVPRVTWQQLKEMAERGHEISNHGWSHKSLPRLEGEALRAEIEKNDTIIFNHTGVFPRTFCYPGNAKSGQAIAAASANRVDTRTQQFSVGSKSTDENLEKRVADLIKHNAWGVTMTHGIHYGYDHFASPQILWDHLEKVKAQEDKIWVATFHDVAAYVKCQKAITCDVVKSKNGLRVTPHIALDKDLFATSLTAVIDRPGVEKVAVRQGGKALATQIFPDRVLFHFDPFGGEIDIEIEKQ